MLLVFSVLFYAWGEPVFVAVLLCSVVCNYYLGIGIEKAKNKKTLLHLSLGLNLGIFIVFKYLTFFMRNLSGLL